jgi:hypothetical protein
VGLLYLLYTSRDGIMESIERAWENHIYFSKYAKREISFVCVWP